MPMPPKKIVRMKECKLTGYYPDPSPMEGGFRDMSGRPLYTLQDHLNGGAPFVSVALDRFCPVPYGCRIEIPSIEQYYGKPIIFRRVDCGGHFEWLGLTAIDICTETKADSLHSKVNEKTEIIVHFEEM